METIRGLFVGFCTLSLIGAGELSSAAIFGRDNRHAINEHSADFPIARATAVAILTGLFEPSGPDTIKLLADSFEGYICPREKFAKDPSLSYACSGFLIAPDLIATAGHCMVNFGQDRNQVDTYCQAYAWLFDYYTPSHGKVELQNVPNKNLYRCKQVIYAVNEDKPPFRDFALVQLERPVTDRTPLKVATSAASVRGHLKMIGYPLGTPAKLSRGGRIVINDPLLQQFTTNLDALEGNSGSAVLNSHNEVVGILVAGEPIDSFVKDSHNTCELYNRCTENGHNCLSEKGKTPVPGAIFKNGSDVQRIAPLMEIVKELPAN